jgi:hypothetical protein
LIELVIVVTITPLIVGALAAGLIAMFSLQSGVSNRLSDSADAQVVSTSFSKDVEAASSITTNPTLSVCGTGTQLIGLQVTSTSGAISYISYVEQLQAGSTYSLIRNTCTSAATLSSPSSETISYDVLAPGSQPSPNAPACALTSPPTCQTPPVVYEGSVPTSTGAGWLAVQGITKVTFPIYEASSKYSYSLQAEPVAGALNTGTLGAPTSGPSCGFALPTSTGSYVSTLCFIDFSVLNTNDSNGHTYLSDAEGLNNSKCSSTGTAGYQMTVAVPGGYSMSFCVLISRNSSNDVLRAVEVPISSPGQANNPNDGGAISNGRGFLGNAQANPSGVIAPFYSGIGCAANTPASYFFTDGSGASVMQGTLSCIDPAIFQETDGATDTVTLSDIVVTDPEGSDATGYEVVTADAETTDPTGSITWTSTADNAANPPSPNVFNVLPDSSSSDLGNACNTVPSNETNTYTAAVQGIDDGDQSVTIGGQPYHGSLYQEIGTNTVTCTSNWQTEVDTSTHPYTYWDRTGTAMLGVTPTNSSSGVTAPVTISAKLVGEGFNAVAFGLLLP